MDKPSKDSNSSSNSSPSSATCTWPSTTTPAADLHVFLAHRCAEHTFQQTHDALRRALFLPAAAGVATAMPRNAAEMYSVGVKLAEVCEREDVEPPGILLAIFLICYLYTNDLQPLSDTYIRSHPFLPFLFHLIHYGNIKERNWVDVLFFHHDEAKTLLGLSPSKVYDSPLIQKTPAPLQLDRWQALGQTLASIEQSYIDTPHLNVVPFDKIVWHRCQVNLYQYIRNASVQPLTYTLAIPEGVSCADLRRHLPEGWLSGLLVHNPQVAESLFHVCPALFSPWPERVAKTHLQFMHTLVQSPAGVPDTVLSDWVMQSVQDAMHTAQHVQVFASFFSRHLDRLSRDCLLEVKNFCAHFLKFKPIANLFKRICERGVEHGGGGSHEGAGAG